MTFRTHTLLDALGRAVRTLSLALLPALAVEGGQARLAHRGSASRPVEANGGSLRISDSTPYLTVIAPPSLRFRDIPAPPNFDLEPVAESPVAMDDIIHPPPPAPQAQQTQEQSPAVVPPKGTTASKKEIIEEAMEVQGEPPAILPDDMRREVRPEDLLPFFQFPKSGGRIGVAVPVPAQAPAPAQQPSSATYRLQ